MSKMSTDLTKTTLNGPTMGTRWSVLFHASQSDPVEKIQTTCEKVVAEIDQQMSTWKPDSDLMRFNAAPVGKWVELPRHLVNVLAKGLEIGKASGGVFDVGMGDVVRNWGFAAADHDVAGMQATMGQTRPRAYQILELDPVGQRARKHAAIDLDLSGIAKGYGVDCLIGVLGGYGIATGVASLDGEVRCKGLQPDGRPWAIALERPDYDRRDALGIIELEDASVATSGDYRHWVDLDDRRLSHTMDPRLGGPVPRGPASVTVVAETCTEADAWATALMVLGVSKGAVLARHIGLNAMFLERDGDGFTQTGVGPLFQELAV